MELLAIHQIHQTLELRGIPIHGVAGLKDGYRIDFKDEATPEQRATAEEIVANFEPVAQPKWDAFVAEFQFPGNPLYASVLAKVGAAGFGVQDHWANFKVAVQSQSVEIFAASIAHLDALLAQAGQSLSSADKASWTALMQTHDFPESCWLS